MSQPLTIEELDNYKPTDLKSLAIEQSQLICVYDRMVKKLEHETSRLAAALGEQNQQVLFTQQALSRMQKSLFGRKSEKRSAPTVFDQCPEEEPAKPPRKTRTEFGRKEQPGLALQEVHHKYEDEDIAKHGLVEWEGQYETSELITVIPSQIVLQKHHRHKYLRTNPRTGEREIVTAPGPTKLKEKSRYSIEFGVEIGLAKYHWHNPLDRQRRQLESLGLDITTGTLFDQIDTIAWYLETTVLRDIAKKIQESYVNQSDDTTWKNLESLDTRNKKRFYLWAVLNEHAALYNIYDARSQKAAMDFLGHLRGVIACDGASAFRILERVEGLTLSHDWYHVRRKFCDAESAFADEAGFVLDHIALLSKIEEKIKGKTPDEILSVRQAESVPLVEKIRNHIDEHGHVLPKSTLGRAIRYTNKLWDGLIVFLSDPFVPFHTNDVERAMRGPATGRKVHFGSKNIDSAKVAAIWYTVVETCKINGVDPREYLIETLKAILEKRPYKLPWEWKSTPADFIVNSS